MEGVHDLYFTTLTRIQNRPIGKAYIGMSNSPESRCSLDIEPKMTDYYYMVLFRVKIPKWDLKRKLAIEALTRKRKEKKKDGLKQESSDY
jgi:hypothetical protein